VRDSTAALPQRPTARTRAARCAKTSGKVSEIRLANGCPVELEAHVPDRSGGIADDAVERIRHQERAVSIGRVARPQVAREIGRVVSSEVAIFDLVCYGFVSGGFGCRCGCDTQRVDGRLCVVGEGSSGRRSALTRILDFGWPVEEESAAWFRLDAGADCAEMAGDFASPRARFR